MACTIRYGIVSFRSKYTSWVTVHFIANEHRNLATLSSSPISALILRSCFRHWRKYFQHSVNSTLILLQILWRFWAIWSGVRFLHSVLVALFGMMLPYFSPVQGNWILGLGQWIPRTRNRSIWRDFSWMYFKRCVSQLSTESNRKTLSQLKPLSSHMIFL